MKHPTMMILFFLIGIAPLLGQQEIVLSTYPGTDLKVERVYEGSEASKRKVKEVVYYENGQVWMQGVFKEDSKYQDWTFRYPNGNPYWHSMIIEDKLEGEYKFWYENGRPAEIIKFKNNQEHGEAFFYHENGELAMKGQYENGKMVGEWSFYDRSGRRVQDQLWSWVFFDSADLRMHGWIKDGKMDGNWEYVETANAGKPYRRQFSLKYNNGELIQ